MRHCYTDEKSRLTDHSERRLFILEPIFILITQLCASIPTIARFPFISQQAASCASSNHMDLHDHINLLSTILIMANEKAATQKHLYGRMLWERGLSLAQTKLNQYGSK
jgi:hypothetical protein